MNNFMAWGLIENLGLQIFFQDFLEIGRNITYSFRRF